MGHQPDPRFSVGQRVKSFRGESATVHRVIPTETIGKSHRVQVTFDGDDKPDARHFYEEVFEPHGEISEDDIKGWANKLNPDQFGSR